MTIRKILIIIPILVIFFLLQSYFWVPTYEEQSRGNPDRLSEYISASIGDASHSEPDPFGRFGEQRRLKVSFSRASSTTTRICGSGDDWPHPGKSTRRLSSVSTRMPPFPNAGRLDAEGIVKLLQRSKERNRLAEVLR